MHDGKPPTRSPSTAGAAAFAALSSDDYAELLEFARRKLRPLLDHHASDIEDLVTDALLHARSHYDPDKGTFKQYVHGIIKGEALGRKRLYAKERLNWLSEEALLTLDPNGDEAERAGRKASDAWAPPEDQLAGDDRRLDASDTRDERLASLAALLSLDDAVAEIRKISPDDARILAAYIENPRGIAERLGIPSDTTVYNAVKRICRALRKYLLGVQLRDAGAFIHDYWRWLGLDPEHLPVETGWPGMDEIWQALCLKHSLDRIAEDLKLPRHQVQAARRQLNLANKHLPAYLFNTEA